MWYYTARMGEKNSHVLTLVLPGGAVGFVGMILECWKRPRRRASRKQAGWPSAAGLNLWQHLQHGIAGLERFRIRRQSGSSFQKRTDGFCKIARLAMPAVSRTEKSP